MNTFKILSLNVNGLFTNLSACLPFIHDFNIDIIALCETKIDCLSDSLFDIDGYHHVSLHRNNRGGGLRIYYKHFLNIEVINELTFLSDTHESLFVKINIAKFGSFILGNLYRPPNKSVPLFNDYLENSLLCCDTIVNNRCIFVGDINIDVSDLSNVSVSTINYIDLMNDHNYQQLVKDKTRISYITGEHCSLLDHVWTNMTEMKVEVFDCPISDHKPILSSLVVPKRELVRMNFRDFSNKNVDRLKLDLNNIFDDYFVIAGNTVDFEMNRLLEFLTDILNRYFPMKSKTVSDKHLRLPWINNSTRGFIRFKHRLFKMLKNREISYQFFKNYSAILKDLIAHLKKSYYDRKFGEYANDSKKTWQLINNFHGRKTLSSIGGVRDRNGLLVDDKKSIARIFNEYFHGNISKLRDSIPDSFHDHIGLVCDSKVSMLLNCTTPFEVDKIISSLKNKTSIEMPVKFIKLIRSKLIFILCDMFNMCMSRGVYPKALKISRVCPIFKSGDKSEPSNYRPISILPIFNKIFEKILYTRIFNFLESQNVLYKHQYGFRRGRDTQRAAMELIFAVLDSKSKDKKSACLFIDFSSAFDSLDRDILLNKLDRLGIRGPANELLSSYLSDRKQFVRIDSKSSDCLESNYGVPQGSVLGPLLFLVYVNDIYRVLHVLSILYADDTTFLVNADSEYSLYIKLKFLLYRLKDWCSYNKLAINVKKTKIMYFGCNVDFDLVLNNNLIESIDRFRFLGFELDSKLIHTHHVKKLISKLRRYKYITRRISCYLSFDSAKKFYFGLIDSILRYGILVYGGSIDSMNFRKLRNLQFSIVNNLFGKFLNHDDSVRVLMRRIKIFDLSDLYFLNVSCAMYKILNCDYLPFVYDLIAGLSAHHNHNTRFGNNIRNIVPRNKAIKYNFIYQSIKCWNNVPVNIRCLATFNNFKHVLTAHIFSNYE